MSILKSKEIVQSIKDNIKSFIDNLKQENKRIPYLATIIVGDNPASKVYVANKEKACNEVGINNGIFRLSEDISEESLLRIIDKLNFDTGTDGILVQLPLPKHINTENILKAIDPKKDVDGFHPENVAKLWLGQDCIKPCTPQGIMALIDSADIELQGKHVVIVGRSNIVGLPVAKMCLDRNATVTICHSKTENLKDVTSTADILIVAVGKPNFINNSHLKIGAIVIDVGINRVNGKLCGDVDTNSIALKASIATPVPGGVGPMTIACLLENTIECYKHGCKNT